MYGKYPLWHFTELLVSEHPMLKKKLHTTGSDIQQTCRTSNNYVLCWAVQLGVPAP